MSLPPPHRIMLDEGQFNTLIRGGIVVARRADGAEVHIALADIGFDRISRLTGQAWADFIGREDGR